jgi:hypothetical protein
VIKIRILEIQISIYFVLVFSGFSIYADCEAAYQKARLCCNSPMKCKDDLPKNSGNDDAAAETPTTTDDTSDKKTDGVNGACSKLASATKAHATLTKGLEKLCKTDRELCQKTCIGDADPSKHNTECTNQFADAEKSIKDIQNSDTNASAGSNACADKSPSDAKQASTGAGGASPTMPSMPQDNAATPATTPAAAPTALKADATTSPDCTANPSASGCSTNAAKAAADTGSLASIAGATDGGGGGVSSLSTPDSSTLFQPLDGSANKNASMSGGAKNPGVPMGGGSSGSSGNHSSSAQPASADGRSEFSPNDPKPVIAGETSTSSGGFSGYPMGGAELASLDTYLPGHKNAPRSPASAETPHPDITSKYSNIFQQISRRFMIKCKLQELRDCD